MNPSGAFAGNRHGRGRGWRRWLVWTAGLLVGSAPLSWAQMAPNQFQVGVLPPANTMMVTQTVYEVFATVTNLALFTNVTVSLQVRQTTTPLLDDGNPPDQVVADATFSGNLSVPAFPTATNFTATYITKGQDLSVTNDLGELLPESWVTNTTRVVYRAVTRPSNDNFSSAIKVNPAGGLLFGHNRMATFEPGEPLHGNDPDVAASVWWTWAPATAGSVLIDTAGSSFAPILAVYTGATLQTLKFVAWSTNDIVNQLKANVVFDAFAGVTYRIAVAGFDTNAMGDIRLNIAPGGQPDTQPPWVTVITPATQAIVTTNKVLFVGTGKDQQPNSTGLSAVRVLVNNDPPFLATGTTNWSASVSLLPGTNIVQVYAEDIAGNVGRPFVSVVRYVDPVNDYFADALELTNPAGTLSADNTRATREPGEPQHAGNEGGHSVWYLFRTTAPGSLHLTTTNSAIDTLLAVYTGDSLTNLAAVAANDDAVPGSGYSELTASLLPYRNYYIALDGFGGEAGMITLRYTFTTQLNYYSLTLQPALGGTITPPSGLYLAGSTQYVTALPQRDFDFLNWEGSVSSASNPLELLMDQNYTLGAVFRVKSVTEGFESGGFDTNFVWDTGSDAPWLVQSDVVFAGGHAARSAPIGNDRMSWLGLTVTLIDGAGSFQLRVSSEEGWDGLEFYLNGELQKRWTGQLGWRSYQFAVSAGRNRLEWRYVKDANYSAGLDAAFLDNLYLPLPDSSFAARVAIAGLGGTAQVQLQVLGSPNRTYALEASPDLVRWLPVFTNSTPSGAFVWFDTSVVTNQTRFYRALLK